MKVPQMGSDDERTDGPGMAFALQESGRLRLAEHPPLAKHEL